MSANSSRIPVYPLGTRLSPLPPCPPHSASKSLALLALSAYAVKWTDEHRTALVQLTREGWGNVRKRLRGTQLAVKVKTEALNPPDYHVLWMASYPPSGMETDAKERQKRLWENATNFGSAT